MFPPVNTLATCLGEENLAVNWLAGDGSDRSYYRLQSSSNNKSYVLMQLSGTDALALKNDHYDWIAIGSFLKSQGVLVPGLIAVLKDFGALVIEDYGDETFEQKALKALDVNDSLALEKIYEQAIGIILQFLNIRSDSSAAYPPAPWQTRAFDEEKLYNELIFFQNHYIKPLAPTIMSDAKTMMTLDREFRTLATFLGPLSKYFVHRDYHSRNLMYKDQSLAVIDFQDARLGAAAYDLVSLIFDSYIPLSDTLRIKLLSQVIRRSSAQLLPKVQDEIEGSWAAVLLQRQLKAMGSFGYLTLVKNRGNYLRYIKPALETLKSEHIFNKKWPFISRYLIEELLANLND